MNRDCQDFYLSGCDGQKIYVRKWADLSKENRGILQVAHGMAEHGARYKNLAHYLNQMGFMVYCNDHRGHGKSAKSLEDQGFLGEDRGFCKLVEDMYRLNKAIKKSHPGQKVFLLGHSMGSFASQAFIMDYPGQVDGVILLGSNGSQGKILSLAIGLANLQVKLLGPRRKAKLLNSLTFGSYNKNFAPNRTDFDWLNSDPRQVDKYIEDPYCGAIFPVSFYLEFFRALKYIEDPKNFSKIDKNLPMALLAGREDPVGQMGRGMEELYKRYASIGLKDLCLKLYDKSRHEILAEKNKDQVFEDIGNWLISRT